MVRDDFDSEPEYHFWIWAKEAEKLGLVSDIQCQPQKFILAEPVSILVPKQLKRSVSTKKRHVMHGVSYTMDFMLKVNPLLGELFPNKLLSATMGLPDDDPIVVCIDVKPPSKAKTKYASARSFPIKQKWLWQDHGLYVNEVEVSTFFADTWVPFQIAKGIRVPILKDWLDYRYTNDAKRIVRAAS